MAKPPAILRSDKGAATSLALWSLTALILVQVALLIWGWAPKWRQEVAVGKPPPHPEGLTAGLQAQSHPHASVAPQFSGNPEQTTSVGTLSPGLLANLPPPPELLFQSANNTKSGSTLPPPPATFPAQVPAKPAVYATVAKSARPLPPPAPLPAPAASPAVPEAPLAPAPVSTTGSTEVDELLAQAKEALALGSLEANQVALETLKRADLRLPEHPAILREMGLVYDKLGDPAKSQEMFSRASVAAGRNPQASSPAASEPIGGGFSPSPASPPPPPNGPISLGNCKVARDFTCTTGERHVLRMEVKAKPGAVVNAENINVDVFFFDRVNNSSVEQSKCDKPSAKWDLPVDFSSGGTEIVDISYHMPRLSDEDIQTHGRRSYHGYVAKLYYEGRFMGETTEPRSLRMLNDGTLAQP
jgi:hypothetical protein